MEKWDKLVKKEEIERKIYTILKGKIDANFCKIFCKIFYKIEKLIKRKTEAEKVGEESAEAE